MKRSWRLSSAALISAIAGFVSIQYWPDRWVQDDAYIFFRYAKNWVNGLGLVWNSGEHVEGYTSFLWTLLCAIPLKFGSSDPLGWTHGLGFALLVATYTCIAIAVNGRTLHLLGALPLLALSSFHLWYFSGMETGLVSFLWMAFVGAGVWAEPSNSKRTTLFSSVSALLLLTRMDLVFGVALTHIAWLLIHRKNLNRVSLLALMLPVFLIYGPYFIWRYSYYGDFFPNTYYAKLAYLSYYSRGWDYVSLFWEQSRTILFIFVSAFSYFLATPSIQKWLLLSAAAHAANCVYLWRLGGDFMEWRFLLPTFAPWLVGVSIATVQALEKKVSPRHLTWVVGLFLAIQTTLTNKASNNLKSTVKIMDQDTITGLRKLADPPFCWAEMGRRLKAVLPPGTRLATTAAGMIPYYYEGPVLDLHGLNDRHISHLPVSNRGRIGHEIEVKNLNQMRELGADVALVWPDLETKTSGTAPDRQAIRISCPDERYFFIQNLHEPKH